MDREIISEYMRDRLLYECGSIRAKLNYEIEATERQLKSVEKRLVSLKHDVYVYLCFIFVPLPIMGLMSLIASGRVSVMQMAFQIVLTLFSMIYIIALPFNLYHLIKSCILLSFNKEIEIEAAVLPPKEGTYKGHSLPQEKNFRTEQQKLVAVLTRYYLNEERLNKLEKEINAKDCTMTMYELKLELMDMPFYEDIRPADSFSGAMAKKTRRWTWIIFTMFLFGLTICILLIVI